MSEILTQGSFFTFFVLVYIKWFIVNIVHTLLVFKYYWNSNEKSRNHLKAKQNL